MITIKKPLCKDAGPMPMIGKTVIPYEARPKAIVVLRRLQNAVLHMPKANGTEKDERGRGAHKLGNAQCLQMPAYSLTRTFYVSGRQSNANVPSIVASRMVHPVGSHLPRARPLGTIARHAFTLTSVNPILLVDVAPNALKVKSERA
jgi:hypothetical protein